MFNHSKRSMLTISAVAALTIAALAPTAAFAKGPGNGAADCTGDCTADATQTQTQAQQLRARDGSGQQAETKATAGGGDQVRASVGGGKAQNRNSNRTSAGTNAAEQTVAREGRANGKQNVGNGRNDDTGNGKQGAGNGPDEDGQRGPGSCDECDAEMGELTEDQVAGLIYMANEEKLAHDVYAAFADLYGVRIFENIANSEARHQEAVNVVLERYGLEDTAIDLPAGEFSDPIIASLYETLIAQGSASLDEAIAVGVLIEETDIADLESRLMPVEMTASADLEGEAPAALEVTAPDVAEMYSHLLAGSGNHLEAFTGWQS